jgi:hypothetical protein
VSIDRRELLALATLIALAGVQGALAQAVSIIGLVTDSGGAPLGGVTVEVYRSGSFVGSTTTLANGYFSIPLPGTGTYDIVTYKRGYEKKGIL